jgi:hypothetical protein
MTETYHGWVSKPLMEEFTQPRKQINLKKQQLASDAQTRYGDTWCQRFDGKTKKAIWAELTQSGGYYPSLSTFYSHVRHIGLPQVLNGYFHFHEIWTVIRVLGLCDDRLNAMIHDIETLERQSEQQENNIRKQAFAY